MGSKRAGALNWHIRAARMEDLPQILSIEQASHPDPWGSMAFESEMTGSRHSRFWVAVLSDPPSRDVAGYVCFRWLADEVYVINLTVAPDRRGRGVGSGLLSAVIEWGGRKGAERAVLEVRGDNEQALGLYRKFGFRPACPQVCLGLPVVMVLPFSATAPLRIATQSR